MSGTRETVKKPADYLRELAAWAERDPQYLSNQELHVYLHRKGNLDLAEYKALQCYFGAFSEFPRAVFGAHQRQPLPRTSHVTDTVRNHFTI